MSTRSGRRSSVEIRTNSDVCRSVIPCFKRLTGGSYEDGYYITKQRKPEELRDNISFEEARSREHQFFQTEAPWKNLTSMHSRMGTPNLTAALSKLLGKVIQDAWVVTEYLVGPHIQSTFVVCLDFGNSRKRYTKVQKRSLTSSPHRPLKIPPQSS